MKDFSVPTIAELQEEERLAKLPKIERELENIRLDMLNGKIKKFNDPEYDDKYTCYEDAIGSTLFWAEDREQITPEENDRLWKKYVS